jgi:hypothetical protein
MFPCFLYSLYASLYKIFLFPIFRDSSYVSVLSSLYASLCKIIIISDFQRILRRTPAMHERMNFDNLFNETIVIKRLYKQGMSYTSSRRETQKSHSKCYVRSTLYTLSEHHLRGGVRRTSGLVPDVRGPGAVIRDLNIVSQQYMREHRLELVDGEESSWTEPPKKVHILASVR